MRSWTTRKTDDTADDEQDETGIARWDPDRLASSGRIRQVNVLMQEFNQLLWQLAKTFWIIMLMLLGMFLLVIMYHAANYVITL